MSSACHPFAAAEGNRCGRVLASGELCNRLEGSHWLDTRKRKRVDLRRRKGDAHKNRPAKAKSVLVFFDTEGMGDGADHHLVYGAAVNERGEVVLEVGAGEEYRQERPPPEVWLDALLEIGKRTKQRSIFAYGFGYDRTKMLEGLPARTLFMLTRREARELGRVPRGSKRPAQPVPLYWNDYILDLQGTRFSVAKVRRGPDSRPLKHPKTGRRMYDRMVVWDVLKFFQCPFVDALESWRRKEGNAESSLEIGTAELERMRKMKGKRSALDAEEWSEVVRYCQSECRAGAQLVRELTDACEKIGANLRRWDGAGSISDALMRRFGVEKHMSGASKSEGRILRDSVLRRRFLDAVMRAFAGGRFETGYCGVVRKPVYVKDIAGAYPYAMARLPCLACGEWERDRLEGKLRGKSIDRRIEDATLALVRVRTVGRDRGQAFGSLANRDVEGNITFPIDGLTWCWKPEYLAARDAMKDRLEVLDAYLYHVDCGHRPFGFLPELYLERLKVGKEGRGIALKLGYNGCAGKTMQRVGSAKWQEYIWAGNTTSGTRAQLLDAIGLFRDQWEVCYLATDSVFATRDVPFPEAESTGTAGAAAWGKPPLGGWERGKSVYEKGMVFVRPGIAFPLEASEEQLKEIKARGISKSVLLEQVGSVVELMTGDEKVRGGGAGAKLGFRRRLFAGMKMSVTKSGGQYHTGERYGQWYEQDVSIQLAAQPKRLARLPGEEGMLLPWPNKPESLPYGSTRKSVEARALEELQDILLEQPDLDSVVESGYGADE